MTRKALKRVIVRRRVAVRKHAARVRHAAKVVKCVYVATVVASIAGFASLMLRFRREC